MKTAISYILCLCLAVYSGVLPAQNLVPNGSFETYTSLPNSTSDWQFCVGWSNVNGNLGSWPYSTPDYCHTLGSGDAKLPNSKHATVNPYDGNAIMGFYSRHASQLNARDYVATQLSSPLVVGNAYTISFWLTSGNSNHYYGSSSSNFGVQLTMAPMSQANHENIGGTPQAIVPGNPWLTNWAFYSFNYVATSAYQYVTVGNFYTDAATTTTLHEPGANFPAGSYYFIDDLKIEPAALLPVEFNVFDVEDEGEFVNVLWETATETDLSFYTIERSVDAKIWNEIGRVNSSGNGAEAQSYSFPDREPLAETSYYRLKLTSLEGTNSTTDVKSITRIMEEGSAILLYPNPTHGQVTIVGNPDELKDFRVFNSIGQDISSRLQQKEGLRPSSIMLDLSDLPAGVYFFTTPHQSRRIVKD